MFFYGKYMLLIATLVAGSSAFILSQDAWDGLEVTWGANPLDRNTFASLPRTVQEATSAGFKKISGCEDHKSFRGNRYVKGGDYATIVLFDKNGFIAGLQAGVKTSGYPFSAIQPPFIKDGDHHFITAYFVDPSTICSSGRSSSQFKSQGTGSNLYIQNGPDPIHNSNKMPAKQSSIGGTRWVKGKCFPTMGVHYWYDLHRDMDCQSFFPVFLLYNGGKLTAFGWAFIAELHSSRYEHPSSSVFQTFMQTVPTCLAKASISTMHIYLTKHPALNLC